MPFQYLGKDQGDCQLEDDLGKYILEANERSFQIAFETAVRTGTALVFSRNGKIVEVKPPYWYELVPIKPAKKNGFAKRSRSLNSTKKL